MTSPIVGQIETVAPGLRRLLAPNPSPMTYWGTNTFIIGDEDIVIVDPGPADAAHVERLLTAFGDRLSHILVTHPHLDHSPAAKILSDRTGATIGGYGPADQGLAPQMLQLRDIGGGEGVDVNFAPGQTLREGDVLVGRDWSLKVLEIPGHFAGQLAFAGDGWILTADHVMSWASSLISPPHGDLAAFRATSGKLLDLEGTRFFPAHGPELSDPKARLQWLLTHRDAREKQVLAALNRQPQNLSTLARAVYSDLSAEMLPAAERNLLAHLIDLINRGHADCDGALHLHSNFRRT